MAANGGQERRGRETRLLVLVVVVSIAVLLLVARLRFPAAELAATVPAPGPLAGLAKQAAFDDLAQTMGALVGRISTRVAIVELAETTTASRGAPEVDGRTGRGSEKSRTPIKTSRLAVALLVRPDVALLHVPAGTKPFVLAQAGSPVEILVLDTQREIALIRVTPAVEARAEPPLEGFSGFQYVGVVEAAPGGPTIQPVFIGRVGSALSDPWPGTLFAIDRSSLLPAGALVFSIDTRLVGLVVRDSAGVSVVPPSVLETLVAGLMPGGAVRP